MISVSMITGWITSVTYVAVRGSLLFNPERRFDLGDRQQALNRSGRVSDHHRPASGALVSCQVHGHT
jgi:hypothetical protein